MEEKFELTDNELTQVVGGAIEPNVVKNIASNPKFWEDLGKISLGLELSFDED